jgi:hypothetical protein
VLLENGVVLWCTLDGSATGRGTFLAKRGMGGCVKLYEPQRKQWNTDRQQRVQVSVGSVDNSQKSVGTCRGSGCKLCLILKAEISQFTG